MPIRPEFRPFYRTPEWREARHRILTRAGGQFDLLGNYLGGAHCEQCGKPDRNKVETFSGVMAFLEHQGPAMFWRTVGATWRSWTNTPEDRSIAFRQKLRVIQVVLAVVHLNHTPGDDRDENLKACCQWCHLNLDKSEHRVTRSARKDATRPLLQEAC